MPFTQIAAVVMALTASLASTPAHRDAGPEQWPMAGQNINDTHHQAAEHKISAANVGRLKPRWTLTTAGAVSATPTVVDGVVYVPDYGGKLWAVAATSGRVLWSKDIADYTGVAGDVSRTSPALDGQNLILGDGWILSPGAAGAKVFAVNRHTGKLVWSTQVDTDPASMITGSPAIHDGIIYQGVSSKGEGVEASTFRGKIVALDARTGRMLWKTYTVPSNNGDSDSNLPGYYTGNAVWSSSPVIDPVRGLMYVGTGNNYTVPDGICEAPDQTGCTPSAPDNYLDSILALRLRDGHVAWSVRTIDSDLWTVPRPAGPDYDFGAGPNLFTTVDPATGHRRQLLGIGQKSGVYWAVEPATGKVAWQTVGGPAGNGGNGGIEYGTATDGRRIYVAEGDTARKPYVLGGTGPYAGRTATAGSWAALDPATGRILWQTPDPGGSFDTSFVSSANGVVYAGSLDPTGTNMYALDARTGQIKWSFASGGSVTGGAAIADGSVYWGSGYCGTQCLVDGTPTINNNKLYAFGLR
ncbi:outer membrane protein assembly factor BamB family protein [Paractinoplanes toevensis]|uniref:Polyvinylalcohol dehydrogenase n=1 Tax=Paractinoplanes toevensis TaxID=571911 RepID=A0A919TFC1_9ACTN|nr:PQQ-binding-like beta-propeller repeat protein [Actinoplanes toevensis]GIM92996.1 polyvinylalcohol dehydrogenase [Actinoplanes toevensis]